MNVRLLLRFLLFQAAWFTAVASAARGTGIPGVGIGVAATAFAIFRAEEPIATSRRIAAIALAGSAAESLLGLAGLEVWAAPATPAWLCAPWLAGVWLLFAATSTPLFDALHDRPWLAAALGAVAGPASYLAAARLGAVTLSGATSTLAIATVWAVALPVAARAGGQHGGRVSLKRD